MLTHPKVLRKLARIEREYDKLRFERVAEVPCELYETRDHLKREPAEVEWRSVASGDRWGGDWVTGWFRGDVAIPEKCDGLPVFVEARLSSERAFTIVKGEALFFSNGDPRASFDRNHHFHRLTLQGRTGEEFHFAFEAYSGHTYPGVAPFEDFHDDTEVTERSKTFGGVFLVLEREDVSAFMFDLRALRQLVEALGEDSLRRGEIVRALERIAASVHALPAELPEGTWRPALSAAREIMRPLLEARNGSTAPRLGMIAHSHIDTAWLWPYAETWRKCARTFATVTNLMERYPETVFLQSAPIHLDAVRRDYPELFERIRALVKEGRWEPNGAAWLEPDCNIPSGESLVRQFLLGRAWTREHLDYTGDAFWQPDVFGYSGALPQILKGCGVDYFLTTKMAWNDTTRFPFDTFRWRGIDGTEVLTHLASIPQEFDLTEAVKEWRWSQHMDSQDRRLLAYGHGDGGGGPTAESMEMLRRLGDLEGAPRCAHIRLSDFMRGLAEEPPKQPVWVGELYLELHRGTFTSMAAFKRFNRRIEINLREAEFLWGMASLDGVSYPTEELRDVWIKLLLNQFHDIIPGTSIAEANDDARRIYEEAAAGARGLVEEGIRAASGERRASSVGTGRRALVVNSLNWVRAGAIELRGVPRPLVPADRAIKAQWVRDLDDHDRLVVAGFAVPALGAIAVDLLDRKAEPGAGELPSAFQVNGDEVESPFATVRFDQAGRIVSLRDKTSQRELVRENGHLNEFLIGEDVPEVWDNWDIDRDQRNWLRPETRLLRREIIADGPLQLRLRQRYKLGRDSSIVQDVVFHATSPRVDFETVVDWSERHMLLKVGFDLRLWVDKARHEIQFGHVERATHRNYPHDRARFEVCQHKWTDLSETGFGVALLNDCKYGVSVLGAELRLSLLKSGTHPDPRGDAGRHAMTYALLPHQGGFSVESVVRPAYELNLPPSTCMIGEEIAAFDTLFEIDAPNVIVETVKRAESGEGLIVRVYEAGGTGTWTTLRFRRLARTVAATNLLEDPEEELAIEDDAVRFFLRPFQIQTLLLRF